MLFAGFAYHPRIFVYFLLKLFIVPSGISSKEAYVPFDGIACQNVLLDVFKISVQYSPFPNGKEPSSSGSVCKKKIVFLSTGPPLYTGMEGADSRLGTS